MGFFDEARQWVVDEIQATVDEFAANNARDEIEDEIRKKKLQAFFEHAMGPAKDAVMRAALAHVGLNIPDGPVNQESITQAINEGPLADYELEISNVFDKRELRATLERVAIKRVAEQLGLEIEADSIAGLKEAIIDSMKGEIAEQLAAESGDIFDAAIPTAMIVRQIQQALRDTRGYHTNAAEDMSDKGARNREKQARYRATHGRNWKPKIGANLSK